MSNTRNKKIILLASTGLVTLSTMAVVLLGQNDVELMPSKAAATPGRVVTVNKDNRILNYYDDGNQNYGGAIFLLDDKLAYGYIDALQSQKDVHQNKNNCVICLWGDWNAGFGCGFYVNIERFYNNNVYSLDGQHEIDVVPFRHLTGIDFTLEKGSDRLTTLKGTHPDHTTGTMTKIEDTNDYRKYHWTPEGGYLDSDSDSNAYFEPDEPKGTEHKALWITEMVFYYDC